MLLSTTPTIEGKKITKYLGIVTGEAIMGADIGKDFLASITNIVGGRSGEYEGELKMAKDISLKEMTEDAESLGANAIIGIDLDYETMGQSGTMLMVSTSGTAVVLE